MAIHRPEILARLLLAVIVLFTAGRALADRREWYTVLGYEPGLSRYETPSGGSGSATEFASAVSLGAYYGLTNTLHVGARIRATSNTNVESRTRWFPCRTARGPRGSLSGSSVARARCAPLVPGRHQALLRPPARARGGSHPPPVSAHRVLSGGRGAQLSAGKPLEERRLWLGGAPPRVPVLEPVGGCGRNLGARRRGRGSCRSASTCRCDSGSFGERRKREGTTALPLRWYFEMKRPS